MTPARTASAAVAHQPVPARPAPRRPTRRPSPPPRRHLRVVRPPRRRRRRARMFVVTGVALSLVAVFGLVAFNVFLVQSQFQLERLEQQVEEQREEYERLRLEAARLSSPERILDRARTELGMVDPVSVTHLTAPSGSEDGADPTEGGRAWSEVKPFLAAEP